MATNRTREMVNNCRPLLLSWVCPLSTLSAPHPKTKIRMISPIPNVESSVFLNFQIDEIKLSTTMFLDIMLCSFILIR
jgi:hypothetical protein